jgi:hypothetical protein
MRRSVSALITGIFCASLGLSQRPQGPLAMYSGAIGWKNGTAVYVNAVTTTMARPPMLK